MGEDALLQRLGDLVSPYGVVGLVTPRRAPRGLSGLETYVSSMGRRLSVGPGGVRHTSVDDVRGTAKAFGGPGTTTRLIAVAEAAERYAASGFVGSFTPWLTAAELDGPVIDLMAIPRCSERELADERCPLTAFDADAPMRWTLGTDLVTGEATWLPAVMACYGIGNTSPAEGFWYRISTGYAVHTDPVEALVRSICEVVERDMVALTWLQQLALPAVSESCDSELLTALLEWSDRRFRETYLLDATGDLGIPTVYCLQISDFDDASRQVVGCGTGRDITAAAEHAFLETLRSGVNPTSGDVPSDVTRFARINDGAHYMARRERAAAFDFIIEGARRRAAAAPTALPDDPREALSILIDTLAAKGMQAIAVDRTPRELRAVGLTATVVVIPQLQPMSLLPLAQYRAHRRLYEAPTLLGYRSLTEKELNPWPLPFA